MLSFPDSTKKVDPRVMRTRKWIRQAFWELLAEKGFQAITVQDITARAGINRATFYAHFTSKYDLLSYAIRETFREELETRVLSACHYSAKNLHTLMLTVCEFVERRARNCKNADQQFHALIESQIREQIRELVLHWLRDNSSHLVVKSTPDQVATVVSWAIYGLAYQRHQIKPIPPVETYVASAFPLIAVLLGEKSEDVSIASN